MCMGDMNQHNIIMLQGKVMTFRNFEKLGAHLQMKDVYFFMRKILEKNHWSVALADQMIEILCGNNAGGACGILLFVCKISLS